MPSVMLSPYATYLVALNCGARDTDTAVTHVAACFAESCAEQNTVVFPTTNVDPLAGVHVVETGAAPPVTVGGG
jgi:hypothetical protein